MSDDLIKVLRMDESAQVRQDCGEQRVSSREARSAETPYHRYRAQQVKY